MAGEAPLGFLAIEPAREAEPDFTAPYVLIEGVYAVRAGSPLRSAAAPASPPRWHRPPDSAGRLMARAYRGRIGNASPYVPAM